MYPSLEKWYEEFKEKAKTDKENEQVSDSTKVIENN